MLLFPQPKNIFFMKHSTIVCTLLAGMGLAFSSCQQQASSEKPNPLLAHEDEITEIISGMSLEEKVNMLHGKKMFSSAGIERLNIADIEYADGPVRHPRGDGAGFLDAPGLVNGLGYFLPYRFGACRYLERRHGLPIR